LPWSSDNRPIIVPPSTESLGKRNHDLRNRSTGVYQQYPPNHDNVRNRESRPELALNRVLQQPPPFADMNLSRGPGSLCSETVLQGTAARAIIPVALPTP